MGMSSLPLRYTMWIYKALVLFVVDKSNYNGLWLAVNQNLKKTQQKNPVHISVMVQYGYIGGTLYGTQTAVCKQQGLPGST